MFAHARYLDENELNSSVVQFLYFCFSIDLFVQAHHKSKKKKQKQNENRSQYEIRRKSEIKQRSDANQMETC